MLRRLTLLALLAAFCGACTTHKTKRGFRIGSGCQPMDENCVDAKTAEKCRDQALVRFECTGPTGCVDEPPAAVACDQSGAREKLACPVDGELTCTAAKDGLLKCTAGSYVKTNDCPAKDCAVETSHTESHTGSTDFTATFWKSTCN